MLWCKRASLVVSACADKQDGDIGMPGFRAWAPPSGSQHPQQSRKRGLSTSISDTQFGNYGDSCEGAGDPHAQMLQGNGRTAMHRPGGSALHSRTKQQCLQSGHGPTSGSNPMWDRDTPFPSYTQLARQQVIHHNCMNCPAVRLQ